MNIKTTPDFKRICRLSETLCRKWINRRKCIADAEEKLLSILSVLMDSYDSNKEDMYLYIETALNLRKYEAKDVLYRMRSSCYEQEKWNRLAVRYYCETGQTDEMRKVLENVKNSNIYLTKDGKEWFRFWSKGLYDEKDEDK